jgi:RimJ/RimL family protein N-acetyltransferase
VALGGTVRGKKTTLRLAAEADLESYGRWMADLRVRRAHKLWQEPAALATWKDRLKEIAKEKDQLLWSIDADGKLIGFCCGRLWSLGAGFLVDQLVIDPDEWRKGYGFDAGLALHRFLFDYLDLRRTDLEVHADNGAALRIAGRLGYAEYARGHEAYWRDGAYVDQVRLFMDKETWHERWDAEREYPPLAPEAAR